MTFVRGDHDFRAGEGAELAVPKAGVFLQALSVFKADRAALVTTAVAGRQVGPRIALEVERRIGIPVLIRPPGQQDTMRFPKIFGAGKRAKERAEKAAAAI